MLVTYMRSGSTFLGELLNHNPKAFILFEALDGVYKHLYGTKTGWYPEDLFYFQNMTLRSVNKYFT